VRIGLRPTLAEAVRLVRKSDAATAPPGSISERVDGAFVDSVPAYPGYWHGNRIVLDRPPSPDEIERWRAFHRQYFAWREGEHPAVVTWYDEVDVPEPEIVDVVQTALLAPLSFLDAPLPDGLHVVDASTDAHWAAAGDLSCAVYPRFGEFNRWRVATLRALVERGRGIHRILTDADGAIVAAAGGFHADGVGRFANVATAAGLRRKGCAAFLITSLLRDLRKRVDDVVIVAPAGGAAERLYLALGFFPILSIRSIER
jgi:ribosomal protein S18 acetylase RimI-like enzyme